MDKDVHSIIRLKTKNKKLDYELKSLHKEMNVLKQGTNNKYYELNEKIQQLQKEKEILIYKSRQEKEKLDK